MSSEYQIAWAVAMTAGLGLAGATFFLFRKLTYLRYLMTGLVAVWTLMPWRFSADPTHLAPAFVVLTFQAIFERDANPMPVFTGLMLVTALVLVVFLIAYAVSTWRRRQKAPADGA